MTARPALSRPHDRMIRPSCLSEIQFSELH
jgi:hypothetical protein